VPDHIVGEIDTLIVSIGLVQMSDYMEIIKVGEAHRIHAGIYQACSRIWYYGETSSSAYVKNNLMNRSSLRSSKGLLFNEALYWSYERNRCNFYSKRYECAARSDTSSYAPVYLRRSEDLSLRSAKILQVLSDRFTESELLRLRHTNGYLSELPEILASRYIDSTNGDTERRSIDETGSELTEAERELFRELVKPRRKTSEFVKQ